AFRALHRAVAAPSPGHGEGRGGSPRQSGCRLNMTPSDKKPDNVTQLRGDINRGETGDKVAGNDPAAAPLGTDEEAAGTPPSGAEVGPPPAKPNASPARTPHPTPPI